MTHRHVERFGTVAEAAEAAEVAAIASLWFISDDRKPNTGSYRKTGHLRNAGDRSDLWDWLASRVLSRVSQIIQHINIDLPEAW